MSNWGQRRGLPPLNPLNTRDHPPSSSSSSLAQRTGAATTQGQSNSTNSPSRTFSPTSYSGPSSLPPSSRQEGSRASSISSVSSPFSPSVGAQQPSTSQLLSSSRIRTIPSSTGSQQASSVAASALQGATSSGSGGGGLRLARASPSLSQSSDIGSPQNTSTPTSAPYSDSTHRVSSLVSAQISLLFTRVSQEKDQTKREQEERKIIELVAQNGMEVFSKFFRRLLSQNATYLFGGSSFGPEPSSFHMLQVEMQKIRQDPEQAKKIAESLDTSEGDTYRDFDVSTFMERCKLDPVSKSMLALALKTASKPDLKTKADAILSNNLQHLLMSILNPTIETGDDLPPSYLASLLDRLLQNPPRIWNDESQSNLNFAIRARYEKLNQPVPSEVLSTLQIAELTNPTNTLVKLIQKTGEKATSSLESCKDMLASAGAGDISYAQVASALLFMVITQNRAYNPSVFVNALRDHRAGKRLDWQDVVHSLDREDLTISKQQFLALYGALLPLAQEYENFDIQLLWGGQWQQLETQLSFVIAFLSCSSEELDASAIPRLRKAFTLEEFDDANEDVKKYATQAVRHPLVSLDATTALFNMIFQSQDTYKHAINLGIPEAVINPHTDFFVVAAAAVPQPWGGLQDQAFKQLFTPFLQKRLPGASFVFHGLWKRDTNWLATKLIEAYTAEPSNLTFIFDHAMEHDWLGPLTGINNEFGVDLASYAHSKGKIDFEAWLQHAYQAIPNIFPGALANFIEGKAQQDLTTQKDPSIPLGSVMLSVRTVFSFLTFLQSHLPEESLTSILRTCIQAYPRLINYGEGFDEIIDLNSMNGNSMSSDADAAMQEHFKMLYNKESEVRELVTSLRHYKHSEEPAEQELFACMIAGLFDEYNCFSEYPDDALATTAVLFGNIINYQLLSRIALQAGLSMVLEALQNSTSREDKMYKFGVQALKETRQRLSEWPSFCERLITLPDLNGTEIWAVINNVVKENRNVQTNGDTTNGTVNGTIDTEDDDRTLPFASLRADSPLHSDLEIPEEATQDTVLFALNNISERNLDDKFQDIKEAITNQHHQWFAKLLTEDRAKSQPNFHELYLNLLILFDDRSLWEEVIRATIAVVVRLLNADSTATTQQDRVNIKNLGTWLGHLTLARDKPIKHRNISFVDLLIEGNKTNRIVTVISFTCQVLKAGAPCSKTFMPPNPWTLEITSVLLEFYNEIEIKLQTRFEIELLCKALDIADMKSIEPSNVVRQSLIPQFDDGYGASIPELEGFADLSLATLNRQTALRAGLSERFSPSAIASTLPDLSTRLYYPPAASNNLVTTEQTRQVFLQAAQSAINEIIFPVVERSVTIAAISASQLVTKDFATEADENQFRTAAHSMVKALAGSLALVTCREPLRMSMSNNVRALARNLPGENLAEGVILMFVNENIDVVCKVVEEAAEKQSVAIIEEHIVQGIQVRQHHALNNPSDQFEYPNPHKFAFLMPEPFKPSATADGLRPEQLAIYEGFGPSRALTNHAASASQDRQQLPDVMQSFEPTLPNFPTPSEMPAVPKQSNQQRSQQLGLRSGLGPQLNGFSEPLATVQDMVAEIFALTKESQEERMKDLSPSNPVRESYENLLNHMDNLHGPARGDIALLAAEEALKCIFVAAQTDFEIEIMVRLVADCASLSVSTAQKIWQWLATFDDERFMHNSRITVALLTHGLIEMSRIDAILARAFQLRKPVAMQFLEELMEAVLLSEYPVALRADLARSIEALSELVTEEPDNQIGKELLDRLWAPPVDQSITPGNQSEENQYIFSEWVAFAGNKNGGKLSVAFIRQLHQQGFLKDPDSTFAFFRACLEYSLLVFDQELSFHGTLENAYTPIDALAQLVVSMILYQGDPEGEVKPPKGVHLENVLAVIALIQCHHFQQRGEEANQKIFFRLFSGILCEVHNCAALVDDHDEIMIVFGKLLLAIQPAYIPGFSFAWLSLVSHRIFLSSMLKMSAQEQGWDMYLRLMEIALTHTGSLAESRELTMPARRFYCAVLKIVLVLHHDFPEFLTENHIRLCNSVSSTCAQLKNLVLSAFPTTIPELPDPFSHGFKVDRLEDIRRDPVVRADFVEPLSTAGIRTAVDDLLQSTGQSSRQIKDICQVLSITKNRAALLHALVLYIGTRALTAAGSKGPTFNKNTPYAQLIQTLARALPTAARYELIGAIVNQLRYPNSHTHYFSYTLLDMFGLPSNEPVAVQIQEQIARTLLERLIVFRPHPWGLLITILELYKNPKYDFFKLPFVQVSEELWNLPALQARGGGYV
ncbi:Not1-domain-containing protein [Tothia fuscella]|uniref:Not1-domain-containing protein n=1 Tax=Tothia fuscella TaxID=1048955 RepID=A0A9P4U1C8_9PEZI|nr:Not1-domain-containing protein [Tothia fuscella]